MTEQPRVTILYPAQPDARFDFGYYVPNHLPLAVGTSLRHAAITYCDADRPVNPDPPHRCLCVVGFASPVEMDRFRNFVATAHPDTARILADEPNYTDIRPLFVAGMARTLCAARNAPLRTGHRVRLLFTAAAGSTFDLARFEALAGEYLWDRLQAVVELSATEMDRMTAGVMPESHPDFHCIWTGWVRGPACLDSFAKYWSGSGGAQLREQLRDVTNVPAQMTASEVAQLDMEKARAISRRP
jgi:hypothetical protein